MINELNGDRRKGKKGQRACEQVEDRERWRDGLGAEQTYGIGIQEERDDNRQQKG